MLATFLKQRGKLYGFAMLRGRPNPPRRLQFLWAAMLFTCLAVYGSLVPLNYQPLSFDQARQQFLSIPYFQLSVEHRADWVANILLFVPLGFLWMAAGTVDRRSIAWKSVSTVAVFAACVACSLALEFTQIWFPPRTVSQNDIVAETLGGLIGVLLWLVFGQAVTDWLRQFTSASRRADRIDRLLQLYLVGLLIYSVMPLDLTIHPVELYRKFRAGRITVVPFANHTLSVSDMWGLGVDALLFVPIGFLATRAWLREEGTVRSGRRSMAIGLAIVILIEFCQVFVYTRFSDATDIIVGGIGIGAGVLLGRRWQRNGRVEQSGTYAKPLLFRFAWLAFAAGYSVVLCLIFWWPLEPIRDTELIARRMEAYFRVPFAALYWGSEFNALTQVLRKTLLFAVLGAVLLKGIAAFVLPARVQKLALTAAFAYTVVLATGIELVQCCLPPHVPDVTDTLLYVSGALGGILVTGAVVEHRRL